MRVRHLPLCQSTANWGHGSRATVSHCIVCVRLCVCDASQLEKCDLYSYFQEDVTFLPHDTADTKCYWTPKYFTTEHGTHCAHTHQHIVSLVFYESSPLKVIYWKLTELKMEGNKGAMVLMLWEEDILQKYFRLTHSSFILRDFNPNTSTQKIIICISVTVLPWIIK